MRFFLHRAPRAVACACAVFAAQAGSAVAAEFSLNPTRVHLDRARAVETLVLGLEQESVKLVDALHSDRRVENRESAGS